MSIESESDDRFAGGPNPLETALIVVGVGTVALYLAGVTLLSVALTAAALLTGLLAVAVTVLWIGDAI